MGIKPFTQQPARSHTSCTTAMAQNPYQHPLAQMMRNELGSKYSCYGPDASITKISPAAVSSQPSGTQPGTDWRKVMQKPALIMLVLVRADRQTECFPCSSVSRTHLLHTGFAIFKKKIFVLLLEKGGNVVVGIA